MIKTEHFRMGNRELVRTYSDSGVLIERDGAQYSEAIDPVGFNRVYTETDIPVEEEEISPEEAMEILEGLL